MTNKEAIEILKAHISIYDCCKADHEANEAIELAIRALGERPLGDWIGNAFDEHHCSICGHSALWEEEPDGYYEVQSRFCPNCGADMWKGGAEEQ